MREDRVCESGDVTVGGAGLTRPPGDLAGSV